MSEYIIETIEYKNHTIEILPDEDAENPRSWDNVGTMICFHRKYTLGDKHSYSDPDDLQSHLTRDFGASPIVLPLYLYDHSGITMSCSPFSCPWDSGQVGVIVCSREKAIHEWGKKRFTKAVEKKAISYLQGEVTVFDKYITGDFVGYRIKDKTGELTDSCWGYEDSNAAIGNAKSTVDYTVKKQWEKRQAQLKTMLKNHVPLSVRQMKLAL